MSKSLKRKIHDAKKNGTLLPVCPLVEDVFVLPTNEKEIKENTIRFIQPQDVDELDMAFGGKMKLLLPAYEDIPEEFKDWNRETVWNKWQSGWFYSGLKRYPVAKEGINLKKAMRHLAAIQSSWEPQHEHKSSGVAWLASLWFSSPDGDDVCLYSENLY